MAIKVAKEQFGDRFRNEALSVAALNHPHICTLFDVGPDYLVMEYVEGKALRGPLPVNDVLRLAGQMADALDHAHRHGRPPRPQALEHISTANSHRSRP